MYVAGAGIGPILTTCLSYLHPSIHHLVSSLMKGYQTYMNLKIFDIFRMTCLNFCLRNLICGQCCLVLFLFTRLNYGDAIGNCMRNWLVDICLFIHFLSFLAGEYVDVLTYLQEMLFSKPRNHSKPVIRLNLHIHEIRSETHSGRFRQKIVAFLPRPDFCRDDDAKSH